MTTLRKYREEEELATPILKKEIIDNVHYVDFTDYPDSDGEPMADNTKQFEWIVTIKEGLETQYEDDENVFVAGNLLWYPKQGDNETKIAPDAMVVFGVEKGYRGSYKQWIEGNVAPQIVFEVWSPGNKSKERIEKKTRYEELGVEEFYEYDPHKIRVKGWIRKEGKLKEVKNMEGWVSPKLGVRFEIREELELYHPDGSKFETFLEINKRAKKEKQRAEEEKQKTEEEKQKNKIAEHKIRMAEYKAEKLEEIAFNEHQEKLEALKQVEKTKILMFNEEKEKLAAKKEAEEAKQRAAVLAQKLKELGIDL